MREPGYAPSLACDPRCKECCFARKEKPKKAGRPLQTFRRKGGRINKEIGTGGRSRVAARWVIASPPPTRQNLRNLLAGRPWLGSVALPSRRLQEHIALRRLTPWKRLPRLEPCCKCTFRDTAGRASIFQRVSCWSGLGQGLLMTSLTRRSRQPEKPRPNLQEEAAEDFGWKRNTFLCSASGTLVFYLTTA